MEKGENNLQWLMGCSLLSQCNGWNDIRSIFPPPGPVQMCVHTKQLYISADISCIKVWLYAAGTPCRIISYYGYDEKRILILNWKFHSFASISKSPYISTSWIYISISSNWIAVSLFLNPWLGWTDNICGYDSYYHRAGAHIIKHNGSIIPCSCQ